MRRGLLRLLACLTFAVSALAEPFEFTNRAPEAHQSVDVRLGGEWKNGCVPRRPQVSVDGATITVTLRTVSSGCPQAITAWSATAHLGTLPAGAYEVVAVVEEDDGQRTELGRQPLIVRDTTELVVEPRGATVAGAEVRLHRDLGWPSKNVEVFFDGVKGGELPAAGDTIVVTAPPHAAGAVDIAVRSGGETFVARKAFIYYDPAAPPDPALFEPVLFPVSFEGPGAHGSQWVTENTIGGQWRFREALPCAAGCSSGRVTLANDSAAGGRLLWLMRGSNLAAGSRIRDVSAGAQSLGTEIPVVLESNFRRIPLLPLMNVPTDDRSRATLRVWALDTESMLVILPFGQPLQMTPNARGEFLYAETDITEGLRRYGSKDLPLALSSASPITTKVWAMVTITRNDAQQVTVVSPQ